MEEIVISIKSPGKEVEHITGISNFVLVTIPFKDPEHNTAMTSARMSTRAIAEIGAFMIRLAKHMQGKGPRPVLGEALTHTESRIIQPSTSLKGNKLI